MRGYSPKGNLLVLFLPVSVFFFLLSLLIWDVGRWCLSHERAHAVGEAVLLSSLRIRAEGLQTIANRWEEFGQYFMEGDPDGIVTVPSARWSEVQNKAGLLRRGISGYQGRVTAVLRVVAEANGFRNESIELIENKAQALGVSAEPIRMRDEAGSIVPLEGGWYRRLWGPLRKADDPPEESRARFQSAVPLIGKIFAGEAVNDWKVHGSVAAKLRWNVDRTNPSVLSRGNGGYPRNWPEALEGSRVEPHRFPYYEAVILTREVLKE